uniref:50S ribosomal protein L18 n=1 Tax=Anthurium amnicola TaxID=1678845 RepID=A0A1D1ZCL6_9ARAE
MGVATPGAKRYVLRLFISLKYITANVVDRRHGRVVATASSVEKSLKDGLECGRLCNAKAAAAVGEVLAMRLKVDGLASHDIHADVSKEVQKKGFKNRTKVWAILHALRSHGVNLLFDHPHPPSTTANPLSPPGRNHGTADQS